MKVLYLIFLLVLQERRYLAVLPCEMGEGLPQDIVKASSVLHYTLIDRAQKNTTDNVLTRENIMVILQRKNIDPTKCSEASCAVEYARLLGADRVVTCSILRVKNINYIYLHLYETETGRVLNSVQEKTPGDVEEVIEIVGSLGERIFTGEVKKKEVMEEKKEKKEIIKPEKKIEGRKGILYITSEPSGAMIIVDERDTGEKTPTVLELDEGWHDIKIIRGKEYEEWERSVYVKADKETSIEAFLEKKKELFGFLKIESEPDSADVYIDGEKFGKTPLVTKIKSGKHKVKLIKEGYPVKEEVVSVPPDKKALLRIKLEEKRIMNFRASWEFSPYHVKESYNIGLDTNVKVIGPLYANFRIGGGIYPAYTCEGCELWAWKRCFQLSSGTEIQFPLLKRKYSGLYNQPISIVGGFKFFEYIHYRVGTNHFGVSFYGGINLLYLYFGLGYRIMTSEECGSNLCDPSGFFLSLGLRVGL